jgi:hypothetical protein
MRRERALKVVLVLLGLLFCAAVYPLLLMVKQDPALAMMRSLYAHARHFLAACIPQPVRAPQPDCFHCMVELRARGNNVLAGVAQT